MVKKPQILVVWWGKDCSSKTRMFTGPHSSLIRHSIKAGSPGSRSTSYFWSHLMLNSPGDHPALSAVVSCTLLPSSSIPKWSFLGPFCFCLLLLLYFDLISKWFTLVTVIPQLNNFVMWLPVSSLLLTSPGHLTISFQQTQLVHFSTSHLPTLLFSFITLLWYIDRKK